MNQLRRFTTAAIIALVSSSVHAGIITFDEVGIVHGTVISDQYDGVTISANNFFALGGDYAVAYDSSPSTSGEDPDLEGPGWGGGNMLPDTELGNVLIIQENRDSDGTGTAGCDTGTCDDPDDEGERAAGELIFDFDKSITSFGLDLVDVEAEEAGDGYLVWFYNASEFLGGINFTQFALGAGVYDQGAIFGNNTINHIAPIDLSNLSKDVNRVVIQLGGSGAVDNIQYSVPEPLTVALFGVGLLGLGFARRRKHN